MTRILVVEDDPDVIRIVEAYLARESFKVAVARDGFEGLDYALKEPPDLVVLDWMLPGMDGLEFIKRLRAQHSTPVIMLTARKEETDRVLGLEFGADDYVSKPFSPRELAARVKAVLRRTRPEETDKMVMRRAGLVIDPAQRSVSKNNDTIVLTTIEFDLLYTLARMPGRVFTRNELLDRIWGKDFAGIDRVVDVHVSNLRHKLDMAGGGESLLLTVRGIGYKFKEDRL
ncbi:MAG: response regulator transcription factor [Trueperaceae bacterium]|nr:MAG: response regulator transcription factor [Trueperaceae bacterium]